MPKKTNFERSTPKASGEKDAESYREDREKLLKRLRENNRELGLPEDDRTIGRPTPEDKAREEELALARKAELTSRKSHQSRGFDVRELIT